MAFEPPPVQPRRADLGRDRADQRPGRCGGRPRWTACSPFGLAPAQLPDLLANVSRLRPGGLDGYDVVVGGTDDWRAWRDAGATWWLRVLPWSRPIAESADIAAVRPARRMSTDGPG